MKLPAGSERVARSLLQDGPATAAQLAERLGITGTAARKHLDVLLAQDFVAASEQPPFGPRPLRGRGRPARIFALTAKGRGAMEQAYEHLADRALAYLQQRGELEVFAEHYAASLGDRLGDLSDVEPVRRPAALAAALSREGYAAEVVHTGPGSAVQICQHHCPVADVASKYPHLCEAETSLLSNVLGTHVMRLATIAHGDGVCTTHIPDVSAIAHTRLGRTSA